MIEIPELNNKVTFDANIWSIEILENFINNTLKEIEDVKIIVKTNNEWLIEYGTQTCEDDLKKMWASINLSISYTIPSNEYVVLFTKYKGCDTSYKYVYKHFIQ